jgi:hypothetical protein
MFTRILTPTEWESLRANLNPFYQILSDAHLHTGLSSPEFWEFTQNPHWYLPAWHRIKLNHERREVFLSMEGTKALDTFVAMINAGTQVYRDRASFRDALVRGSQNAGLELEGINPAMFRPTIASWLSSCFPEKMAQVVESLGCTSETIREITKERKWNRKEMESMRLHLKGWGE